MPYDPQRDEPQRVDARRGRRVAEGEPSDSAARTQRAHRSRPWRRRAPPRPQPRGRRVARVHCTRRRIHRANRGASCVRSRPCVRSRATSLRAFALGGLVCALGPALSSDEVRAFGRSHVRTFAYCRGEATFNFNFNFFFILSSRLEVRQKADLSH